MIIKNGNVLWDNLKIKKSDLYISGGKIADTADGEIIDADDCYVLPGLVDTHIHGAVNSKVDQNDDGALDAVSVFLASKGVTTFAATTRTLSKDEICGAIERINKDAETVKGAKVGAIHLEGPFISHEKKGALLDAYILDANKETFDEFMAADKNGLIKIMTMAPESKGAETLIPYAVSRGVTISLGHSSASAELTDKMIALGAKQSTHTFNAMSPLNHREPGILGSVMLNDSIKCELIADFIHVSPKACDILYRLKGDDRINLISDSEWCAGMPDGEYTDEFGRKEYIEDGIFKLANGTIAGSTKWLLLGVQNLVRSGIAPLESAVKMASLNPAKTIGLEDKIGSIKIGKQADLIILDKNLELLYTIVDGEIKYKK